MCGQCGWPLRNLDVGYDRLTTTSRGFEFTPTSSAAFTACRPTRTCFFGLGSVPVRPYDLLFIIHERRPVHFGCGYTVARRSLGKSFAFTDLTV